MQPSRPFPARVVPGARCATWAFATVVALACAPGAVAQDRPLWEAGVGVVAGAFEHYPASGSNQGRALVYPWLVYRGDILRVRDGRVHARLFNSERWHVDVGFDGAVSARSADIPARAGMPDLGYLLEAGPRIRYRINDLGDRRQRWLASLSLRGALSVGSGTQARGAVLAPSLDYRRSGLAQGRLGYSASLSVRIGSRRYMDYYYGVAPAYAIAGRPGYDARAGYLGSRLSTFAAYRLDRAWTVFGFAQLASYAGAANESSPLFRRRWGYQAGIGFAYRFGESGTRVNVPD
ncbi:MAG: MipA/OmpV family protein [Burkholderiaceae bacterium]|nr:MipA/OmpV family protein [Burkholderiaceae bacterium]